ncbi:hypothetical protein DPMN_059865 [Dreissena polymorpha]|uniref:Uncharacterized protein n=1 Tax=Dreissena polymorpha TaxID=45954 RepID=A0A9D4C467_DREPO|nr:hypothetical protein DPMN_059865 [Dreissena polymorpha]
MKVQLLGYKIKCLHFGSQAEGTTVPGLQSDIDFLIGRNSLNIMRVRRDWKAGFINLLMLYDEITSTQQCLLHVYRMNTPKLVTELFDNRFVRKYSGEVLMSAERWKDEIEMINKDKGDVTQNWPSVSWIHNWDMVHAFAVCKPLPEIQHWIDKCTGRPWPPAQLLEAARVASCFLVPAGHPDHDCKREEWRLSPDLIERMLLL